MQDQDRISHFADNDGFIAALDQSGGSTPVALARYGVAENRYGNEAEMMALVHEMRSRIMRAACFSGNRILGVILFEKTMTGEIDGQRVPDFLWNRKGVLPFLKIDDGLADEEDGISLMRPISGMEDRLEQAREYGMFGTKMRSVIHRPGKAGVDAVVEQQFEFAETIIDHGFLPIVEPEVSIACEDKEECEEMLFEALIARLEALGTGRRIALKLTLPELAGRYADLIAHDKVVRVTALSGGYDREEACRRLAENPGMVASFSRALLEGLDESQDDPEFDRMLGETINRIYAASCT